jgi:hypothetical protein
MDQHHRGYLLRGSNLRGRPQVAVFSGKDRLHIADGGTMDEAFVNARGWVDAMRSRDAKERRPGGSAASVKEYIRFFRTNPPKEYEVKMLQANARGPLTAGQLAQAASWESYEAANSFGARMDRSSL